VAEAIGEIPFLDSKFVSYLLFPRLSVSQFWVPHLFARSLQRVRGLNFLVRDSFPCALAFKSLRPKRFFMARSKPARSLRRECGTPKTNGNCVNQKNVNFNDNAQRWYHPLS